MFLKRTRSKNFTYLSIVETFREGAQVKHNTLLQLGREDQVRANGSLQRLIDSIVRVGGVSTTDSGTKQLGDVREQSRHNWGSVAVYRKLWQMFGLSEILQQACRSRRRQFDLPTTVFAAVLARTCRPSSKKRIFERQQDFLSVPTVSLQHLYRAMDALAEGKDEIEQLLFERQKNLFNLQVDVVLYDVTTLYFESVKANELKDFGYSKDAKFGEVQVVLGLIADCEGRPIGFDVFPGNTFEGHTLVPALNKLKAKFNIRQVVVVADRGMNNKVNLLAVKQAGFDYIVGGRLKNFKTAEQEDLLDRSKFETLKADEETGEVEIEVRTIEHSQTIVLKEGEEKVTHTLSDVLVCTWSKKRASKDAHDREILVERAKDLVKTPSKIIPKRGPRRFINTDVADSPVLNEDRISLDAKWDGFYGIQCSRKDLSPRQILEAYHTLWRIEDAFRVLKHSLQARPIFHWTESRIRGHLVMCFIAFLLERTIQIELRQKKIPSSPEAIRDALACVQVSVLSSGEDTFYMPSAITEEAKKILAAFKISSPTAISTSPPIGG